MIRNRLRSWTLNPPAEPALHYVLAGSIAYPRLQGQGVSFKTGHPRACCVYSYRSKQVLDTQRAASGSKPFKCHGGAVIIASGRGSIAAASQAQKGLDAKQLNWQGALLECPAPDRKNAALGCNAVHPPDSSLDLTILGLSKIISLPDPAQPASRSFVTTLRLSLLRYNSSGLELLLGRRKAS